MKKLFSVLLLALTLVGAPAMAQQSATNWTYAEVTYSASDVEDRSFDSYSVGGSLALGEHLFVQGAYTNGLDTDLEAGAASVSAGLRDALTSKTDLYGKVTGSVLVSDRKSQEKYEYTAEAGLRSQVTDTLELRGGVIAGNLRDQSWDSITWLGTAGAELALTKNLRLGADVRGKDGWLEGQLGLRLYF